MRGSAVLKLKRATDIPPRARKNSAAFRRTQQFGIPLGCRFTSARYISLASDQNFHEVSLWVTPPLEQRSAVARDQSDDRTKLTNYQLYSDSTLTRLE